MSTLPPAVEAFLDPAARRESDGRSASLRSNGPTDTLTFLSTAGAAAADARTAQLVVSGLLQACMDVIETNDDDLNNPVRISKVLFQTAAEKDIPWQIVKMRLMVARPDDEDAPFSEALVGMSYLKIGISAIRFLANCHSYLDEETTVAATRLVWRCLSSEPNNIAVDHHRLADGALPKRWRDAADGARASASSWVHSTAKTRILEPPSAQDRALLRWMLRPDVFSAMSGWFQSTASRRSPHVAANSKSWRLFRQLLIAGHHASLASEQAEINTTKRLIQELRLAPIEQSDGSTCPLPTVSLVCANRRCQQPAEHRCSRCQTIWYCSR